MTQEEKAKAYDEAIDKVAHFIKKHIGFGCMIHPNSSEAKELFNIFPQLKDSDNEKIRRCLIDYFDDANKADENPLQSYGVQTDKVIAWLEKQGQTFTKKDVDDAYLKGVCDTKHELEKQGEQNPVWSEEDEERIKIILSVLDTHLCWDGLTGKNKNTFSKEIDWLKSLKERVGNFDDGYKVGFSAAKHNQWKPSDEQMAALYDLNLTGNVSYSKQGQTLIELYNNLKKLK